MNKTFLFLLSNKFSQTYPKFKVLETRQIRFCPHKFCAPLTETHPTYELSLFSTTKAAKLHKKTKFNHPFFLERAFKFRANFMAAGRELENCDVFSLKVAH